MKKVALKCGLTDFGEPLATIASAVRRDVKAGVRVRRNTPVQSDVLSSWRLARVAQCTSVASEGNRSAENDAPQQPIASDRLDGLLGLSKVGCANPDHEERARRGEHDGDCSGILSDGVDGHYHGVATVRHLPRLVDQRLDVAEACPDCVYESDGRP